MLFAERNAEFRPIGIIAMVLMIFLGLFCITDGIQLAQGTTSTISEYKTLNSSVGNYSVTNSTTTETTTSVWVELAFPYYVISPAWTMGMIILLIGVAGFYGYFMRSG